jgi:hypothetical protein
VLYELDNVSLGVTPPPGSSHGEIETKFVVTILDEGEKQGLGKVKSGDVGIVLWRNPDRVVGADVAFITNASLLIGESLEGTSRRFQS